MVGSIFKERKQVSAKEVMRNPIHFLAFGLGSGLSPIAPGTMGSLLALPFAYLLKQTTPVVYVVVALIVTVLGIWVADKSSKLIGEPDHGGIVIDEIAGMLWIFVFFDMTLLTAISGFFIFRFFDVVKPWPVSYFDKKVEGGLGIMLDDLMAAVYSIISLWLVMYLFAHF